MICVEYFFPKQPANCDFPSARTLRKGVIPLVVGHVLIACLGMAFVSIVTFAVQFLYIAMLYSVYMTLRPWIVWMYMILLGFNVLSGVFSVFLYQGATFAVYLIILVGYSFFIIKIRSDSAEFRNMSNQEGGNKFYLEDGIRHMVNTAREEYPYGRNVLGGAAHVGAQEQNNGQQNAGANNHNDAEAAYGEPLLQNHYLNQMRERD